MAYKQSTHKTAEIDAAVDSIAAHIQNAGVHMTAAEKQKLGGLENYDDTELRTELGKRLPMTVGTSITDPDPDNGVYANLFDLPPGKYWRQNNVTRVQNIPAGLTVAFYCIVENTIASNRRRILLYPATSALAGVFYCCVETGGGYGNWYRFEGTVVS